MNVFGRLSRLPWSAAFGVLGVGLSPTVSHAEDPPPNANQVAGGKRAYHRLPEHLRSVAAHKVLTFLPREDQAKALAGRPEDVDFSRYRKRLKKDAAPDARSPLVRAAEELQQSSPAEYPCAPLLDKRICHEEAISVDTRALALFCGW